MTHVKLLVIVTNDRERRRLLRAWGPFVVAQRRGPEEAAGPVDPADSPVAFARIDVRAGLGLHVFIADGGWRREYVCRALAPQVCGYCLVVGPQPQDLTLAQDLLDLLAATAPPEGIVASSAAGHEALLRSTLSLPAEALVTSVDCSDRASVSELVCTLLEHLAAVPAA